MKLQIVKAMLRRSYLSMANEEVRFINFHSNSTRSSKPDALSPPPLTFQPSHAHRNGHWKPNTSCRTSSGIISQDLHFKRNVRTLGRSLFNRNIFHKPQNSSDRPIVKSSPHRRKEKRQRERIPPKLSAFVRISAPRSQNTGSIETYLDRAATRGSFIFLGSRRGRFHLGLCKISSKSERWGRTQGDEGPAATMQYLSDERIPPPCLLSLLCIIPRAPVCKSRVLQPRATGMNTKYRPNR